MHKQFDLWCISILTKKKTFSANNFLSRTVYTFQNIHRIKSVLLVVRCCIQGRSVPLQPDEHVYIFQIKDLPLRVWHGVTFPMR